LKLLISFRKGAKMGGKERMLVGRVCRVASSQSTLRSRRMLLCIWHIAWAVILKGKPRRFFDKKGSLDDLRKADASQSLPQMAK